jgi:putative FmdB family regulatory protein
MPIYQYECNNDHTFEEWEPLGAATTRKCNQCQARAHRIMSPVSINFDVPCGPADFRDSRRESDYDRKLAGAFSLGSAIQKANQGMKQ